MRNMNLCGIPGDVLQTTIAVKKSGKVSSRHRRNAPLWNCTDAGSHVVMATRNISHWESAFKGNTARKYALRPQTYFLVHLRDFVSRRKQATPSHMPRYCVDSIQLSPVFLSLTRLSQKQFSGYKNTLGRTSSS